MSTNLPSFDRAEYALTPSPETQSQDRCTRCQEPIGASYFRINGDMACESCARQATPAQIKHSHTAYTRALLYGAGAAVVGMILYALFEIVTGIAIGYLAIGVGYLVGKAMKAGSGGRGGRRYQIVAALLTYAAVSVAAVPVALYQHSKKSSAPTTQTAASTQAANDAQKEHPFPGDKPAEAIENSQPMGVGRALLLLLGLGLASPFLELSEGFGGVIGLVILFVGIRAAWSLTSGVDPGAPDISGPFSNAPRAA